MSTAKPGYFFLVVGPSGAGKDSLIDAAKERLPADQFVFAKRVVTRPAGMVGEDYESCDPAAFVKRKQNGEFLATWQAHGYHYGLPASLALAQTSGKHIIANGSRAMLSEFANSISNLVVIHVTAPVEILAKRLAARGRETEAEIRERLSRQGMDLAPKLRVATVQNDASLEEGIARFVRTIKAIVAS